jgi:ABC-type transport system substrate-binding protein
MLVCFWTGSDRSPWLRSLFMLALLVAVCGCGAPPEARDTPAVKPVAGGTLRLIQEAPAGLDPVHSESIYESLPINQIFDTLVSTDASLNVVPALAETWQISRDGLTYDFHLRPDVRFHDGEPFDADDVVFTFRRVLGDGGTDSLAYTSLLPIRGAEALARGETDQLEGLEKVDDATVRFTLVSANPLFLEQLAMDNLAIVPEHLLAGKDGSEFARSPVGTGPFSFGAWTDSSLLLRRNSSYFRGSAHLDEVQIFFYDDNEDDYGKARFLREEIDALEPTTMSIGPLSECPEVDLYRYQELSLSFLGLNSSLPPLDQTWLRRAISHAIDREKMVRASPQVRVHAPGILPPGIAGFTPEEKALAYSPDTARRILADAGHPGGEGIPTIKLYDPSFGAEMDPVTRQVLSELAAVGIDMELVQVTWAELGERLDAGTAEAFFLAWIADMSDPDSFLSGFGEHQAGDYFHFYDERTVELLRLAAAEFEPSERGRLYREAERHILGEAPFIPLYHTRGILATHQGVHGLTPGPFGIGRLELEKAWIERREEKR